MVFGLGDDDGDGGSLKDQAPVSRFYRTQEQDCDFCDTTRGSVIVDREREVARCSGCHNDPETFEED